MKIEVFPSSHNKIIFVPSRYCSLFFSWKSTPISGKERKKGKEEEEEEEEAVKPIDNQ